MSRPENRVGIVGGGLMGKGIAVAAMIAQDDVVVIEPDRGVRDALPETLDAMLADSERRGKISPDDKRRRLDALKVSDDFAALAPCEIVIEAATEDLDVKREAFRRIASSASAEALAATNASYLNPREILAPLGEEGIRRGAALHFFHPAQAMKLVEIAFLPQTSPDHRRRAKAFVERLGKVGVEVGICEGYVGNRVLTAMRRQADYMLADGLTPRRVDAAIRAFGFRLGIYQTQDLSGLGASRARRLAARARGDEARWRDSRLADRFWEAGRRGKASGRGWYRYADADSEGEEDDEARAILESERESSSCAGLDDDEIASRIVAVAANEGARILEEGIVSRAEDADCVMRLGFGFPSPPGGPMAWADAVGGSAALAAMERVAAQSPDGGWRIASRLREAASGRPFLGEGT